MGAKWEQKWAGAIWEQNGSNMGAKWAGARAEAARQPMHPSVMKLQGSVMGQSQQRPEPGARRCKCRYMWCPTSTVCWHRLAKQGSKSRKKQQSVLGQSISKEESPGRCQMGESKQEKQRLPIPSTWESCLGQSWARTLAEDQLFN